MSGFWLQVSEPNNTKRVVTIEGRLEVGRDCEGLVLEDPTVSRRHLWLEPTPTGLLCVDMGSANGSYIDGERVEGPKTLRAGAAITLGECELIVYEGHATSQAEGDSVAFDTTDRPSEGIRDLSRAASKTQIPKRS